MIKKLTYELNVVCQHFTKVLQHLVNIFISLSYKFGTQKFFEIFSTTFSQYSYIWFVTNVILLT
jgi:hypothetical protein